MTKEQADKIAKEMLKKNSALIDGKLASINIESLINDISAALVDASKVTECAEFESAFEKTFKTYPVMPMDKLFLDFWNTAFIAGQNSKSLRLPSNTEWTPQKAINEVLEYCEPHLDDMWAARIVGCLLNCDFRDAKEQLKKLNEGK